LLIAALVIRIAHIDATPYRAKNDAGTYNRLASEIAQTGDYDTGTGPRSGAGGSRGPTAYFPPAFPYFLAAVDLLDGHQAGGKTAVLPERIAQAVTGTVAVGLIGLVALEAFGSAVGLVTMALATVYPVLIEDSGTLVAENLLVVFELAAVWAALRARRAEHPYRWIAGAGVLTGLATLAHQNALVMVIPLGFAAWAIARRSPNRTPSRVRALAAPTLLIITTVVTIAPWTIRNAIELHHFIPVSDEAGITLVGTYNAGRYVEVALGAKLQSQALQYIGDHPLAPVEVAFDNTLRMFELEGTFAWHASAAAVDLPEDDARVGVDAFWIVCLLALAGVLTAAARRAPRWLWAFPLMLAGCAVSTAAARIAGLVRPGRRAAQD
jgi:4-amino-4-deoxy-L-arabinose transferase-like glycosyltransferase